MRGQAAKHQKNRLRQINTFQFLLVGVTCRLPWFRRFRPEISFWATTLAGHWSVAERGMLTAGTERKTISHSPLKDSSHVFCWHACRAQMFVDLISTYKNDKFLRANFSSPEKVNEAMSRIWIVLVPEIHHPCLVSFLSCACGRHLSSLPKKIPAPYIFVVSFLSPYLFHCCFWMWINVFASSVASCLHSSKQGKKYAELILILCILPMPGLRPLRQLLLLNHTYNRKRSETQTPPWRKSTRHTQIRRNLSCFLVNSRICVLWEPVPF